MPFLTPQIARILRGVHRVGRLPHKVHKGLVKLRFRRQLIAFKRPYQLHIGCGEVRLPGWINMDSDPKVSGVEVVWDFRNGIPFPSRSCALIYNEHFLEHLPVEQGVDFLREARRVLQPGGVLRIAMPSLDVLLEKATSADWRDQDWLRWPGHEFIVTRAQMVNIAFRWWGHEWIYDREELERRLREAGFSELVFCLRSQSEHKALRDLETREDSLLICEVTA